MSGTPHGNPDAARAADEELSLMADVAAARMDAFKALYLRRWHGRHGRHGFLIPPLHGARWPAQPVASPRTCPVERPAKAGLSFLTGTTSPGSSPWWARQRTGRWH